MKDLGNVYGHATDSKVSKKPVFENVFAGYDSPSLNKKTDIEQFPVDKKSENFNNNNELVELVFDNEDSALYQVEILEKSEYSELPADKELASGKYYEIWSGETESGDLKFGLRFYREK